ncbi:hypothetical protein [Nocardia cyriacigeorgica]|uniref:hypothetical protein n=1 Tax=Nocardia cyriacigeorgica TaxID=135487 RepID=UPI001E35183E|nr:hypothetical protein [Nocardia cyriacigeorgica]MBF6416866.1 hypothetical protein [Nocardia cyriacigeorgica]
MTLLLVSGCGSIIDEGPTNDDIEKTTGLTVSEATRIVNENLNAIWPYNGASAPKHGQQHGCRTNPNSLMSEGPPWQVAVQESKPGSSQQFIDEVLRKLDMAAASRGFTRDPGGVMDDHPADRTYRDDSGYILQVDMDVDRRGADQTPILQVTSRSPCAAE